MIEIESYLKETFPGESVLARCKRRFLKFISIDPESVRTKSLLKSLAVTKAETLRHLLFHRNVIHCLSRFR